MATGGSEVISISKFDGSASTDTAKCWLAKFELYVKYKRLNNEAVLASFPLHLNGQAFDWYLLFEHLATKSGSDFEQLTQAFLKRYGPDNRKYVGEKACIVE